MSRAVWSPVLLFALFFALVMVIACGQNNPEHGVCSQPGDLMQTHGHVLRCKMTRDGLRWER